MKTMIVYATRYGCTEKAVKILQSRCPGEVRTVNIAKVKSPDLSSFDTVIVGGPVYVGKMHTALSRYMQQNAQALKSKRLALFVCAGEQDPAVLQKELVSSFPAELYAQACARGVFGGILDWNRLDFMTKLMLRLVKGIKEGYSRLSEAKIDQFAREVFTSSALVR